ncbi:hypothetical protein XELAEV_18012195mg, partial [Xenopus laevis]
MSSKANGKAYEKANKKNLKLQDRDTNSIFLSHNSALTRTSLSDDYSLIAAEVARHFNPVIESTIRNKILIFQDYSLLLSQKRKEFSKTCQSLANLHINLALLYPAKLKIFLPSGARVFSDPREAHTFVSHMEKKNNGNLALVTPSNSKCGSPPKDQRWKRYDTPRQSRFSKDSKSSQVQTKSRSRSPLPPRTGSLPHSNSLIAASARSSLLLRAGAILTASVVLLALRLNIGAISRWVTCGLLRAAHSASAFSRLCFCVLPICGNTTQIHFRALFRGA